MDQSLEREIRRLYSCFHSPRDLQGRTFAPLADAYRRSGDLLRARLVLEEGLRRHPDFASAHVVALRVARDVSDHEGAMEAARRVLELDPGNTEARRALDHISSQQDVPRGSAPSVSGDDGEPALPEESWMVGDAGVWGPGTDSGLASVDPVALEEEDAQARSLAQTSGAMAAGEAAAAQEVPSAEAVAAAEAAVVEEKAQPEATPPGEPAAETLSEAPTEAAEGIEEAAAAAAAAEEVEAAGEVAAVEAPAEGIEEEVAQPEATPSVELDVETSSEAPAEAVAVEAPADPVESGAGPPPTELRTERSESRGKSSDRTAGRLRASARRKAPPAADPSLPSSSSDDANIITRTMGQLYERQGLYAHAIVVYEHLLESDPDDEGLARHLERLRQRAAEEASTRAATGRARRFELDSARAASAARSPDDDEPSPDDDELPPEPVGERGTESGEAESSPDEETARQPATVSIHGSDLPVVPIESLAPDPPPAGAKGGVP